MKSLNVAICDDEEFYIADLEKYLDVYSNEYETTFNISRFRSGMELTKAVEDGGNIFHIIFLDVEMPEIGGIDTARRIRNTLKKANICFVTSHEDYALNAYEVEAIGYIVKPSKYAQIRKMVDKAVILSYYHMDRDVADKKYMEIQVSKEKIIIDKDKIIYIEKCRNQCKFHLVDGEIACYETLSNIYTRLENPDFIYVHQGYIVHFPKIKEVEKKVIHMGNNIEVPISRKYYSSVKEKHMDKINMLRKAVNYL